MEQTPQPEQKVASLAAAAPERERRPGLRAIGVAATRLAGPIVARHGGGALVRVKAEWRSIIGAEIAAVTWPEALGPGGVLKLRVVPAAALELQHRAPLVIDRINGYFGRPAVTRLILVQRNLPLAPPEPRRIGPLSTDGEAAIEQKIAGIADPELRTALSALGRAVLSAQATDG
jgi:hypothetical protein